MDDAGRPAVLIAWIECESCGRIDKALSASLTSLAGSRPAAAAHDFNYPADMAEGMELFVWLPCEQCGRQAKLHMKREIKASH